jgi:zinc D-Ala-D-Ala carboxypeptidase
MRSKLAGVILVCVILAVVIGPIIVLNSRDTPPSDKAAQPSSAAKRAAFDKAAHSLTDASSSWVVVNKKHPLTPIDYVPESLRTPDVPLRLNASDDEMLMQSEAASALETMSAAARKDGAKLMLASAYRSYNFQKNLYNRYVSQQGQTTADTQSARPGYSEHQTGLAVDLEPTSRKCEVETCFADTVEGKWLAAHAHKYGFILRYPKNGQNTTGYIYEPWHFRYVGKPLAAELAARGLPMLEDFFGLEKAAAY